MFTPTFIYYLGSDRDILFRELKSLVQLVKTSRQPHPPLVSSSTALNTASLTWISQPSDFIHVQGTLEGLGSP